MGPPLLAQDAGTAIRGTVRNRAGAAVAEASIRVNSPGTGASHTTRSDERGEYAISGLAPGSYEVEIARPEYVSQKRAAVEIAAGQPMILNFVLEPQAAAVLLYAREQGQITLILRSRTEKEQRVAVTPANMATVMESVLGTEATGPPPKPQRSVEVFKGLERSVVAVSE